MGDSIADLETIFESNIEFHHHRSHGLSSDWVIFLGGYANNDESPHKYDFSFNSVGHTGARVIECYITTHEGGV